MVDSPSVMDTGEGSNTGNGHSADPTPTPPQSTSPAGGNGQSPEPLVVVDLPAAKSVRDPKTGRILPGHSLNPKGRLPGIPNRNAELVKVLCTTEIREAWKLAKARAAKGETALMEFMLDRAFLKQTPEAAGIAINVNQANHQIQTETNVHIGEHLSDPGTRDAVAQLTERLAARGAFTGEPRHVRQ